MVPVDSKTDLRDFFRKARREFSREKGEESAPRLSLHMRRLIDDLGEPWCQVCLYRPLADEAQFDLGSHVDFFYPRLRGGVGNEMEFYRPRAGDAFERGGLGVLEPSLSLNPDPLDMSAPMLVFCPAVAVDWGGRRIGMGAGYYDRFFSRFPQAVRIGVVFQVQVAKDPLPVDSWDQTLDWIVSEEMILRTSNRSP